jgi:lipid-binding SYLF domain-containing protein
MAVKSARIAKNPLSCALLIGALAIPTASGFGCSAPPPRSGHQVESGAAQQAIVERCAAAFVRMRNSPNFSAMEPYLQHARGVMIFPRLVKASFIVGGEGGNGVLVVRGADGAWSDPAFYSLGAPSVGLQIGYQEASVVLFFMDDAVLERAFDADFTLGANRSAALGRVGEQGESEAEVLSKPIYQVVDVGGAFAGVSLDGYVIGWRSKHNFAYYGPTATPQAILVERSLRRAEADVLRRALGPRATSVSGS